MTLRPTLKLARDFSSELAAAIETIPTVPTETPGAREEIASNRAVAAFARTVRLEILRHALDLCSAECRPPIETLRALIDSVEKGTAK